jgi:hypothetical protein
MGPKGTGKTVLAMNLLHELVRRCGCFAFIVDPKADLSSHKQPQDMPAFVKFLESVDIPPAGLPLKIITPAFLKAPKYEDTDSYYALGMADFNSIQEFSVRHSMMEAILGIKAGANDAPSRKLDELLSRSPSSFEEMSTFLDELNTRGNWNRISVFDINLKQRLRNNVLADGMGIDIPELMQNYIVVLQCSLMQGELINSTYVAFALAQLKAAFEAGRFKHKRVAIVIDESDVLAPGGVNNPPSKSFITQMYTKWRSEGAIPVLLVQDPNTLSDTPIMQTDYVLTPRVSYNGPDYKLIVNKFPDVLMSGELMYKLCRLYSGPIYPKEWVVIGPDQKVQSFFPIYSPSMTPKVIVGE